MDIKLTKDADTLLVILYKAYLELIDLKGSKSAANFWEDAKFIRNTYFPNVPREDITELCFELKRAGFIYGLDSENSLSEIKLTSDAIVYMENRFQNKVGNILDYLAKIKSILLC